MKDFVELWKKDHQHILKEMDSLIKKGPENKQWRSELLDIKTIVLNHLKMEDEKLYPAFREKAKNDARAGCIVDLFESEMGQISKEVLKFFKKYEKSDDTTDFIQDLKAVNVALQKRIWNEENVLLEEYVRVIREK